MSSKFGCPVLSSQETHMPSPVEPYSGDPFVWDFYQNDFEIEAIS